MVEDDLEDAGLTIEALRSGEVPCRISLVCDGDEAVEFLFRQGKFRRAPATRLDPARSAIAQNGRPGGIVETQGG